MPRLRTITRFSSSHTSRYCKQIVVIDLYVTNIYNCFIVYRCGEDVDEPDFQYVPETPHVSDSVPRSDLLNQSLLLLKDALSSGAALLQFEVRSIVSSLDIFCVF